ncbi:MAG: CehA/McbA family metallohydrolase [Planctomycetaceae bacterium]|nr:CehA/McbA family metallohydrolase [Planctomycetaceae bacterium]
MMTILLAVLCLAQDPVDVEGQPLAANVDRVRQALEFIGAPWPAETQAALKAAGQDATKIQQILDPQALILVSINPESRVKAARGRGPAVLQQSGWTPVLIKVVNDSPVKGTPHLTSPQSGPLMSGGFQNPKGAAGRFLQVELLQAPPMTPNLSGLKVEYLLGLIYSSEAGRREATLAFDVGQGTQDLGFRAETPVLFEVKPGIPVKLSIRDVDGQPTAARFTFLDPLNHVYPPQPKRLAPDLFFQKQIYRHDGGTVLLPPGVFTMISGRGPEYRLATRTVTIPERGDAAIAVQVERWVNPMTYGYYSGDHHIHAAGCAHYTNPTEGVHAPDMFLHVKGEGLNVGCNLTWGPCYEYQRQFFQPTAHPLSEPFTVLKYDVEVSGFGSQALGHVCLLNLKDQTYPGSEGTKTKGWPTWTTPLMKWAKAQGAYTGYAHSANGLNVNDVAAAKRLLAAGKDALLPEDFATIDENGDKSLSEDELQKSVARSKLRLPNLVVPEMNGIGAQEICVTTAQGICDFISAMDTNRLQEWNCWYQLMNCGFPLKASGETDFPCISGGRVGEGRVYVQLGKVDRIDYAAWCEGVGKGRSYVSDGYAHALQFTVGGQPIGGRLALEAAGTVAVKAKVAFAAEQQLGTAPGAAVTKEPVRLVELIVNGQVAASKEVPADNQEHELAFEVRIDRSSWVALRHFPQLHTNPVEVLVGGQPIRASRKSALWCIGVIEQLWKVRGAGIAAAEREEAKKTFDWAIEEYRKIAAACPEGS